MRYVNVLFFMVLTLMLLVPSVFQAQSTFGIRAGLNASNISFDLLPDRGERIGYHVGIFADMPVLPDFLSLQPELSYSVQGTAFKSLNDKRQQLNMDYVNFLLPVAFNLGSIDVQVGPFASYLISTPDYTLYNETTVITDAFKKIDAGLTGGLSYNFNKLLIGIRYNQGFIDVTKDSSRSFLGNGKNAVGQVSLGYRF